MECAKCQEPIPEGDEHSYCGQTLCEDCYIRAISPTKTCDVAAVHAATTHRARAGQIGTEGLTELQKDICEYLAKQGKATRPELAETFKLKDWELEKQIAVLRHCELLKARKEGNAIYLVPFDS